MAAPASFVAWVIADFQIGRRFLNLRMPVGRTGWNDENVPTTTLRLSPPWIVAALTPSAPTERIRRPPLTTVPLPPTMWCTSHPLACTMAFRGTVRRIRLTRVLSVFSTRATTIGASGCSLRVRRSSSPKAWVPGGIGCASVAANTNRRLVRVTLHLLRFERISIRPTGAAQGSLLPTRRAVRNNMSADCKTLACSRTG